MTGIRRYRSYALRAVAVALIASLAACGDTDDTTTTAPCVGRVAVLSAFPAELAPLLEQATIDHTMTIEGRNFRIGVLGGVPVVLGLTGIGLLNAAMTTHVLLENFEVTGIVVSAVAGSIRRIGDVTVPDTWAFKNGTAFNVSQEWLARAQRLTAPGTVSLERCTVRASAPMEGPVCLDHEPAIVIGGVGRSSDTFGTTPFACTPGAGDLYGCDVEPDNGTGGSAGTANPNEVSANAETPVFVANDMETAAIAREAAARGLPLIAFRAVSDGAGDPLMLPNFIEQFAAYYRFAARNAAATTITFLEQMAAESSGPCPG